MKDSDAGRIAFIRDEYNHADKIFREHGLHTNLKHANEGVETMHKLIAELLDIAERRTPQDATE